MGILRWRSNRREAELVERAQFRWARKVATEDVVALGESLAALDDGVASSETTAPHWHQALDGYERAQETLDAADDLAALDRVASLLVEARFQRACLVALRAGEPLPVRRDDCFFNPQHGPAMTDVAWTPEGGVERSIEVCNSCARRLEAGEPVDQRVVRVGDRYVAWWEVGPGSVREKRMAGYSAHVKDGHAWHSSAHAAEAATRSGLSGTNGLGGWI
ncbi:hypothetical protein [Nocardioides bigeumensis]